MNYRAGKDFASDLTTFCFMRREVAGTYVKDVSNIL